jgi:hypothetical protein
MDCEIERMTRIIADLNSDKVFVILTKERSVCYNQCNNLLFEMPPQRVKNVFYVV